MTENTLKSEQESDLVEKADEAAHIHQKMVELRQEKKQMLRDKKDSSSQASESKEKTQYVTGTVESLRETDSGTVLIDVEYLINGDLKSKTFELVMPEKPEHYSIEYKYVRLRKSIGVDPQNSIIAREVPLKVSTNGEVSLDIPKKPTTINKLMSKTKRKILGSDMFNLVYDSINSRKSKTKIGILMFSIASIILVNAYNEVGARFIVDLIATFVMSLLLITPLLHLMPDEYELGISSVLSLFSGSILAYLVTVNKIPTVWIVNEYTLVQNSLTALQYVTATSLIICTFYLIDIRTITNKLSNVKKWIQKQRGVEFVK